MLPDALLARHATVNWRDVKAFRDFLIHRYHRIDHSYVWAAVEELPALRNAIEAMLQATENPD